MDISTNLMQKAEDVYKRQGSGESVGGVRNEEIKYEKYKQTDKKYVDYLRYGNRSIYYLSLIHIQRQCFDGDKAV